MKKYNSIKKLGRTKSHRDALLRNLASSLFEHKRIKTTVVKAKTMRSYVEKIITTAKKGTSHSYRSVFKKVKSKEIIKILFEDIVEKVSSRTSGYTRVIKLSSRKGDNAKLAYIELVDYADERVSKKPVKQDRSKRVKGSKEAKSKEISKESRPEEPAKEEDSKQTAIENKTDHS